MRNSPANVRGLIKARLSAGWVPFVRPKADGSGDEEVWAKPPSDDSDLPTIGRPISPDESELVSDIMRNRYLGSYTEDVR